MVICKEISLYDIKYYLGRVSLGSHQIGQFHKLRDAELFGAERQVGLFQQGVDSLLRQKLAERDTQHLAPLVEHGFHNALEQVLVATEVLHIVALHADDGALHLWRRIEDRRLDGEEIFHVVPCLNEHRQDAIGLRPWQGGHAQGHLALDHPRATWDEVAIIEHLEENLRRDVVGIVTRQNKLLALEQLAEVHAQEVLTDDIVVQAREMLIQVGHALRINLHDTQRPRLFSQILRQHTHTGSDLQNGQVRADVNGVGDATGYREVGQEVLTEVLLWSYLFHSVGKGTDFYGGKGVKGVKGS